MKCIRVKDQLPLEEVMILCTDGKNYCLGMKHSYCNYISHDNCAYWCSVENATYWMPLPSKPETLDKNE